MSDVLSNNITFYVERTETKYQEAPKVCREKDEFDHFESWNEQCDDWLLER